MSQFRVCALWLYVYISYKVQLVIAVYIVFYLYTVKNYEQIKTFQILRLGFFLF